MFYVAIATYCPRARLGLRGSPEDVRCPLDEIAAARKPPAEEKSRLIHGAPEAAEAGRRNGIIQWRGGYANKALRWWGQRYRLLETYLPPCCVAALLLFLAGGAAAARAQGRRQSSQDKKMQEKTTGRSLRTRPLALATKTAVP